MERNTELQLEGIRQVAESKNIKVIHTSFELLIRMVRDHLSKHDEQMLALTEDFESFCSEMKLLPNDEHTLFVPPCGQSFPDNEQLRLYYCPADRNLRKARFLGIYADKRVRSIGRIAKVVACTVDLSSGTVAVVGRGDTLTEPETERILEATRRAPNHDWDIASAHRFYLCDHWAATDFRKITRGGIMGHRYFDLREELGAKPPADIDNLAQALNGRTWD